jgi:hypothetical protein
MNFTITVTLPFVLLACFSLLLFIVVTIYAVRQGLFEQTGGYAAGIEGLFTGLLYSIFWAVPSLFAWAAWATWWRD